MWTWDNSKKAWLLGLKNYLETRQAIREKEQATANQVTDQLLINGKMNRCKLNSKYTKTKSSETLIQKR